MPICTIYTEHLTKSNPCQTNGSCLRSSCPGVVISSGIRRAVRSRCYLPEMAPAWCKRSHGLVAWRSSYDASCILAWRHCTWFPKPLNLRCEISATWNREAWGPAIPSKRNATNPLQHEIKNWKRQGRERTWQTLPHASKQVAHCGFRRLSNSAAVAMQNPLSTKPCPMAPISPTCNLLQVISLNQVTSNID